MSMRNANFSKYFSYSITLCFNRLTDIHENMRNRIAKSLGGAPKQGFLNLQVH